MTFVALFVRLKMGPGVLFRQRRPGLHGVPFTMVKFKTMNEERGPNGELLPDEERLTRLGRILRSTSLDELPELFNVLAGDMSLVGPRPLLMQYLDRYTPEQARRHEVQTGHHGLGPNQRPQRSDLGGEVRDGRLVRGQPLPVAGHQDTSPDRGPGLPASGHQPVGKGHGRRVHGHKAGLTPGCPGARIVLQDLPNKVLAQEPANRADMKRIFLSPPHMGGQEQEFVRQAFESNYIAPLGPHVDAFEREFAEITGIPHCAALSSGTAALHLALVLLGVGPGDVVAVSDLTFIGSVSAAHHLGAELVFVDADPATWNMDPDLLEQAMHRLEQEGKRVSAVLPTDLYGQCADYEKLGKICDRWRVPLVADAAESAGSTCRGAHAGKGADFAAFSFNGNKIVTTSGGGMLASEDEGAIAEARRLSQQARDPAPHYEHTTVGYNYRMSNLCAAVGRGQLQVLADRVDRRREIFDFYQERLGGLPGFSFMPEADYGRSNRWLTVVLIDPEEFGADREEIRLALEALNIEARPVWKPMHMQPVFAGCRSFGGDVGKGFFRDGLCLPSGTAMTEEELERVCDVVAGCGR